MLNKKGLFILAVSLIAIFILDLESAAAIDKRGRSSYNAFDCFILDGYWRPTDLCLCVESRYQIIVAIDGSGDEADPVWMYCTGQTRDSDGDGIDDKIDYCPNSGQSDGLADEKGCTCSQKSCGDSCTSCSDGICSYEADCLNIIPECKTKECSHEELAEQCPTGLKRPSLDAYSCGEFIYSPKTKSCQYFEKPREEWCGCAMIDSSGNPSKDPLYKECILDGCTVKCGEWGTCSSNGIKERTCSYENCDRQPYLQREKCSAQSDPCFLLAPGRCDGNIPGRYNLIGNECIWMCEGQSTTECWGDDVSGCPSLANIHECGPFKWTCSAAGACTLSCKISNTCTNQYDCLAVACNGQNAQYWSQYKCNPEKQKLQCTKSSDCQGMQWPYTCGASGKWECRYGNCQAVLDNICECPEALSDAGKKECEKYKCPTGLRRLELPSSVQCWDYSKTGKFDTKGCSYNTVDMCSCLGVNSPGGCSVDILKRLCNDPSCTSCSRTEYTREWNSLFCMKKGPDTFCGWENAESAECYIYESISKDLQRGTFACQDDQLFQQFSPICKNCETKKARSSFNSETCLLISPETYCKQREIPPCDCFNIDGKNKCGDDPLYTMCSGTCQADSCLGGYHRSSFNSDVCGRYVLKDNKCEFKAESNMLLCLGIEGTNSCADDPIKMASPECLTGCAAEFKRSNFDANDCQKKNSETKCIWEDAGLKDCLGIMGSNSCEKDPIYNRFSGKCEIIDSDADGIDDRFEKAECLNTLPGTKIDKDGCSCSQKICDDSNECTDDFCDFLSAECKFLNDNSNLCGTQKSCPKDQCSQAPPYVWLDYPDSSQDYCKDGVCIPYSCALLSSSPSLWCDPASPEKCDGIDNDKNGKIDDGLSAPQCSKQEGVCKGSIKECKGPAGWEDCSAQGYGQDYQVDETLCDGLDNDCDGSIDEGCSCIQGETKECGINKGICKKGTQRCTNGLWGECTGNILPSEETCNGLDDDCDGYIDEDTLNSGNYTLSLPCNIDSCPGKITCQGVSCILESDPDSDEVCDSIDNCLLTYNPLQEDTDGDRIGDVCDPCPNDPLNDIDQDGICGDSDNCPEINNTDQKDSDNDGIGDMCDFCPIDPFNDIDSDKICSESDNCPNKYNPDQKDCDNNGIGDACDIHSTCSIDSDGDGIKDNRDNCPLIPNPAQWDSDNDGIGDPCDPCPNDFFNDDDNDGVCGDIDNCPSVPNSDQNDRDLDKIGDACDFCINDPYNDLDSDNLCGNIDNCPFHFNPSQADCDRDSIGNACDYDSACSGDSDNDGIIDLLDNCADYSNPGQEDSDNDGIGDMCDFCPIDPLNDIDKDGVCGNIDSCPSLQNYDQRDSDSDGIGDACDLCPIDTLNDIDQDGICGNIDNCPMKSNPEQRDCDNNRIGDACDSASACSGDIDEDGIPDNKDNCPETANDNQLDRDGDGIGDACDFCPKDALNDIDQDGICGNIDNCASVYNPNQIDSDKDRIGDACDRCAFDNENDKDGDIICGDVDNCRYSNNPSQRDCDNNGIGDACDQNSPCSGDFDFDDIKDYLDNCPEISNQDQKDSDNDGIGDACDPCPLDKMNDIDQDGICGNTDNCPSIYNPGQSDIDKDGKGDACDLCPNDENNDIDEDGICGDSDNCPFLKNPNQERCDEIIIKKEIYDQVIRVRGDEYNRQLLPVPAVKEDKKQLEKKSEELKKDIIIETKQYNLNSRLFTKYKVTIDTKEPIRDFIYYQNVPKCIAEKAENIYFNGKNYNIIENDPVIAWHFSSVSRKIELTYDVEGTIPEECLNELKDFAYSSTSLGKRRANPFTIIIPVIAILGIIGGFIFVESRRGR